MLNDMLQLFRPLDFLKVQNARRGVYQIKLPLIFAAIIIFLQSYGKSSINILADDAFIARTMLFLQILVPFTIAALAAVATFPSKIMDTKLSGNPKPKLRRKVRGEFIEEELTRRRYVCLLFGYLALLGILLLLLGIILPDIIRLLAMIPWLGGEPVQYAALGIFAFMSGNLLSNTLLGLFYLSDRIHRQD